MTGQRGFREPGLCGLKSVVRGMSGLDCGSVASLPRGFVLLRRAALALAASIMGLQDMLDTQANKDRVQSLPIPGYFLQADDVIAQRGRKDQIALLFGRKGRLDGRHQLVDLAEVDRSCVFLQ